MDVICLKCPCQDFLYCHLVAAPVWFEKLEDRKDKWLGYHSSIEREMSYQKNFNACVDCHLMLCLSINSLKTWYPNHSMPHYIFLWQQAKYHCHIWVFILFCFSFLYIFGFV